MVIHKTMAMPTSCLSCWIAPTCEVWVREKSKYKGYDNRLENCPLEPVKHGHWIEHDVGLICSECNHYTEAMYDEPFNNEFGKGWALKRPYYCGYCGAKMDEVLNVPLRNGKSMMELERLMDEVTTDGE